VAVKLDLLLVDTMDLRDLKKVERLVDVKVDLKVEN
jgi:hypothetical protein